MKRKVQWRGFVTCLLHVQQGNYYPVHANRGTVWYSGQNLLLTNVYIHKCNWILATVQCYSTCLAIFFILGWFVSIASSLTLILFIVIPLTNFIHRLTSLTLITMTWERGERGRGRGREEGGGGGGEGGREKERGGGGGEGGRKEGGRGEGEGEREGGRREGEGGSAQWCKSCNYRAFILYGNLYKSDSTRSPESYSL